MNNFGISIFCDDIRYEIDGKRTFVGCYDQAMLLKELPALLPRFCISVTLQLHDIPKGEVPFEVTIFLPGDDPEHPSVKSEAQLPALSLPQPATDDPFGAVPVFRIKQDLVFSPLEVREQGVIRVRVLLGTEVIKAGALDVRLDDKASEHAVAID